MIVPPESSIALGRFTLLPRQRRVLLDGQPVRLGARAADLLSVLVTRRGEVVPKDELLESVWPGLVVEENNLHVQVRALRKLLGHDAIVTVTGRGYALDAAFATGDDTQPAAAPDAGHGAEVLPPMRGRSSEAATLRQLVRQHRIVTVVGPGGVGKSRLVSEVLAGEHEFPLRRIELADGAPGPALRDAAAASADDPAVVLIENAEHSLEGTCEFANLLADAPGIRLVCTSQVPLHARGEHVLRLDPLPVPPSHAGAAVEMTPALEVMLDSVATLQPGFALDDEDRRDAAAICRHLDGLPLAIGLAAGRVPLLGIAGVRRRLVDRFHLLAGAPRGTAARHQSLQAAMEWSWGLLTAREIEALTALARLSGRFTLNTATASLEGIAGDEWEAMELLGALVDKSVVVADRHSAFRLLESTRLFAQSRAAG